MIKLIGFLKEEEYWGTKKQPFFYKGKNPTADTVIIKETDGIEYILLIQRGSDSPSEPNKWALPGGFVETDARKGSIWKPGKETFEQAAMREVKEETGLDISNSKLLPVGVFSKGGRDPRDNNISWTETHVFFIKLPKEYISAIHGMDDAQDAKWLKISDLNKIKLAFDHKKAIDKALLMYN